MLDQKDGSCARSFYVLDNIETSIIEGDKYCGGLVLKMNTLMKDAENQHGR